MSSIIFYDPNERHHPLHSDPDILLLQCSQCLYQTVLTNNHVQPIVCVCCLDPSTIINEVQQRRQNVLIYLCTELGGHKTLENVNGNIRKNIVFSSNSGWKSQIIFDRMLENRARGFSRQAKEDLQKLKEIEQESLSKPSVGVENQNQNLSSNGVNEDPQSKETEEIEH